MHRHRGSYNVVNRQGQSTTERGCFQPGAEPLPDILCVESYDVKRIRQAEKTSVCRRKSRRASAAGKANARVPREKSTRVSRRKSRPAEGRTETVSTLMTEEIVAVCLMNVYCNTCKPMIQYNQIRLKYGTRISYHKGEECAHSQCQIKIVAVL